MKNKTLYQVYRFLLVLTTVSLLPIDYSWASENPLKPIFNAVTQPELEPDYRFSYGPHASQFGDLRLPKKVGLHPVIVLIHGGCWQSRYSLHMMDALADSLTHLGFATWNIEYRRQGQNNSKWESTLYDVMLATAYIRNLGTKYPLDTNNIVLLGHSSGGHLALWLAGESSFFTRESFIVQNSLKIRGVIGLAPITDLLDVYNQKSLGCHKQITEFFGISADKQIDIYRLSSPTQLKTIHIPQVVISGNQDSIVPQSSIEKYVRVAINRGDKIQHKRIEESDHFDLIFPRNDAFDSIKKSVYTLIGSQLGD